MKHLLYTIMSVVPAWKWMLIERLMPTILYLICGTISISFGVTPLRGWFQWSLLVFAISMWGILARSV